MFMSHGVIKKAPQPPLKYITLSFLQTPLLNLQTVQAPLFFRKINPQYIGFSCPPPPQKKNGFLNELPY